MRPGLVLAVCLVLVPMSVIVGAGALMKARTGYVEVERQLALAGNCRDAQPLYARPGGYSVLEVATHWGLLHGTGIAAERRFLQADLLYPICHGGVLAAAILLGRRRAHQALSPLAAVAPVGSAMLADWTENLAQLRQLDLFEQGGAAALHASWIAVASAATSLKWASLVMCLVLLVWVAWRVGGGWRGREGMSD